MPDRPKRPFVDSNVFLYLASDDERKATVAEEIVRHGGYIGVQVLNEVANVARRKMRLSWHEIALLVAPLKLRFAVLPLTVDLHEHGLQLAQRYSLSIYDGVVAAAALSAKCDTLISEDMQNGLLIDRQLRVFNPFLDA